MKTPILALRLNRRAIAAAVLTDERLSFIDGHHLTSDRDRANASVERYLKRVLELTQPHGVVIDAPVSDGSSTAALLHTIVTVATAANLSVHTEPAVGVQRAFGTPGAMSRIELRQLIDSFWPELEQLRGAVKPYIADAVALALYADTRASLNPATS